MIKIYPIIFIFLWSSAFITTKPIIDYSDPFAALAFRFLFVALGFYTFSVYTKQKIIVPKKNIIDVVKDNYEWLMSNKKQLIRNLK